MTDHIEAYFDAEKAGALILIILGVVSIMPSIFVLMYRMKNRFLVGFLLPVIAIGSIELITGRRVWSETDERKDGLIKLVEEDPVAFSAGERPRMAGVLRSFTARMSAEAFLIAVSIVLLLLATRLSADLPKRRLLQGIGAGLLLQACVALTFDIIANDRAARYMEHLDHSVRGNN